MAGFFGGPATAMSLAIIADVIPPARRGQALGKVAGAFAVASVVGVPVGMRLSQMGGWRLPFFFIAGLGLVVA
jgi:predicted MFS family arabinose efflux permease